MLAIELYFPAGRYHATPWGRHVNEADVEWPPGPWRIFRALAATWHRRFTPSSFSRQCLERLLETLAEGLPVYRLPPGVHSHTRHYMPTRGGKKEKPTLIFDGFLHLPRNIPVIVAWPDVELAPDQIELLDALLESIGYLGRAESWVAARRTDGWNPAEANCFPVYPQKTEEMDPIAFEIVDVMCPESAEAYREFRRQSLDSAAKRKPSDQRAIQFTLPENWLDAICRDTADLHKAGWNQPPAAKKIAYNRPAHALSPTPPAELQASRPGPIIDTIRLAIFGKPLPRIEDAVKIGELTRLAAMGRAKAIFGADHIPSVLSGHDLPSGNLHGHAFWLPEDADGDGRIDHLLIHAPDGFDPKSRRTIAGIRRIWQRNGSEWQAVFEAEGRISTFAASSFLPGPARVWQSITPYLHPWHRKNGFGFREQLARECEKRKSIPYPEKIEILESIRVQGRNRLPVHFHRFRSKRGLMQPDTKGQFIRITFPEPLKGPLALGFGCHFGLGLFAAIRDGSHPSISNFRSQI